MNRKRLIFFAIAIMATCAVRFVALADTSTSTATSTLQDQINEKNKELAAVNQQIAAAQATLQATQSQRETLQQQVSLINGNINSLNLGIQSDQLTTQQLTLEIQQLGGDIQGINSSVADKEVTVGKLLQEISTEDNTSDSPLIVLLKNGTLADSVLEAQNVHNLQTQLSQNISELRGLQVSYAQEIQASAAKQQDIASQESDLQNKKLIIQDQQSQKQALLASTKDQESIFQQQLTALQKQQQSIEDYVEGLDAVLRTKVSPASLPAATAGTLTVPIAGDTKASITQGYGATSFAKNGYKGQWHNGVDLAASIGTPVLAAADGIVAGVGNNDLYCPKAEYGKFIAINFDDNLTGLYGHLSRQIVKVGDSVTRGEVIGYSGETGYALGPHLHFTIFATPTFSMNNTKSCGPMPIGGDLDPIPYLF